MRFLLVTLLVSLLACSDPAVLDNRSGFGEKSQTKSGGDGGKSGNGNEGVEGFLQDMRYARNRCEFNEIDGETFDVTCRTVIALPDGSEVAVTRAAAELKVEFAQPKIKSGGVNVDACRVKAFSQTCRISDVSTIAEIVFIMKTLNNKTKESRKEETAVVLPYSVQNIIGNVMLHTSDYQTSQQKGGAGSLKLNGETESTFGLQADYVPNKYATIFGGDVCFNELGLFTGSIGHIFVTRDGVSTKFAGNDFSLENELDHRLRLQIGEAVDFQPDIFCEEKSLLVATTFRNKIYRMDDNPEVKVVLDGTSFLPDDAKIQRVARFPSGTFLIRSTKGKLYTWKEEGKQPPSELWDCQDIESTGSKCLDGDFIVSMDGKRIVFQDFLRVFEATETSVTKKFEFEQFGDLLRFFIGGKFIYNNHGFLKQYFESPAEGDVQNSEWLPGFRFQDFVQPDNYWEDFGKSERNYIPIFSSFAAKDRVIVSVKEGAFEFDGTTLKQIYGEGKEEVDMPQWAEMDVVTSIIFAKEDEVYFQAANITWTDQNWVLGSLDLKAKKVDYIHGSLHEIERPTLGADLESWILDHVDEDGVLYGRYVRRINADGEDDRYRKSVFRHENGVTTELHSIEYSSPIIHNIGRVSVHSSGAAVYSTVLKNEIGTLVEIFGAVGGSNQMLYSMQFGTSATTEFLRQYKPYPMTFTIRPDGSILGAFKENNPEIFVSDRAFELFEIPFDPTDQTYGEPVRITRKGDELVSRKNVDSVFESPVSWDEFGLKREIFGLDYDKSGNIFVQSDELLFMLRAKDQTVHVIFGNQAPQECAAGLLSGETTEATYADSFRAGFSAFCPGDLIGGFDIRDECSTRGVYRIIVTSGYDVGNFNVLLAERGCPE